MNLGYESGYQMGDFHENTKDKKYHVWELLSYQKTLKICLFFMQLQNVTVQKVEVQNVKVQNVQVRQRNMFFI
jgi:hypothetical protein